MIKKVCGLQDADSIQEAIQQGAQWIGLHFTPTLPHCVSMLPTHAGIIPDRGSLNDEATQRIPKKVGVFIDDMPQNIITRIFGYQLDLVQLDGHETPTMIRNLRRTLDPDIRPGIQFIKTITDSQPADLDSCKPYTDCVDYFMFRLHDAASLSLLNDYTGTIPFLIDGLSPEDLDPFRHTQFAGINIDYHQ